MAHRNYLKVASESCGYRIETASPFHKVAMSYLAQHFFPDKKSRVLDIGVGFGHNLLPLKRLGYSKLIGIDIDSYACEALKKEGVEFRLSDVSKDRLPFEDRSINVVMAHHLIEHLQTPDHFLSEVHRVLVRGGVTILVSPDWRKQYKTFYRDPTHLRPYDKVSISRLMEAFGFKTILISGYGAASGVGRFQLYLLIPSLIFSDKDMIYIGRKIG